MVSGVFIPDRLLYLTEILNEATEEQEKEFDVLVLKWFKTLPKDKQLNNKWITDGMLSDLHAIGRNKLTKQPVQIPEDFVALQERLLGLLNNDQLDDPSFDIMCEKWFKMLPMEKHRDTSWLKDDREVEGIYRIGLVILKKKESGRAFLHKISNPKHVPDLSQYVTEADIRKSLTYDKERRIVFLEGKILETMAQFIYLGYEHGGMIDLKKSGLFDRAIFSIGGDSHIIISDMLDFDITFHTHPIRKFTHVNHDVPSEYDTSNLLPGNPFKFQVHLVFTKEAVYSLYTDPRMVGKTNRDVFFNEAHKYASTANKGSKQDVQNYISFLKKHGVYMFRHSTNLDNTNILWNWPERIPLYINPVEPVITLTERIASRVSE